MNYIKIKNETEEKEYEILFDYTVATDHTKYIVYTDFEKDKNNTIKCYSSILKEDGQLEKITDENQIKFIDSTIKSLSDLSHIRYQIERNN